MRRSRPPLFRGKRGFPALLVVCAGFAAASADRLAYAAEEVDPFALSPEQLINATVTSVSKAPEKLLNAPAAIFVLTGDDILRAGATSIPEALRLVPGVQVARGNASSWAISVRGMNSALANKLLVLIDGREVYDSLFSGVYWDIQDTAIEDIDRIEVIRGPGATLWGANAVNGVINIITKRASETKGGLASVVAGNQDRALVTGRFGAATDDAHWRVFAKYVDRASEETLSGANARDAWNAWRGGLRADWDADKQGDSFTLQGDVYSTESGKFRALPELTPPYANLVVDHIEANGGNVLGRWNRDLDEGSSLTLQAYLDVTSREQLALGDDRWVGDVDLQYRLPQYDRQEIIAGAHYRYTVDELTATPVIFLMQRTLRTDVVSGFVQDKITLDPDHWFLTLGTKVEHNDFSGFEIQPSARLQWLDDPSAQMAWASISRAVRTPNLLEHDLRVIAGVIPPGIIPIPVSVQLFPSPTFESEELIAYEAGYRRQWTPSLLTDISVFYNDYDKLATLSLLTPFIGFPPLHAVLPIGMTNLTSGAGYGFEAWASWRVCETVNLAAAYSYVNIELHGPPSSQAIAAEAAEGQSPRNQFNLRAQWDVSDSVVLDSTLYYRDSLPAFGIDAFWRFDTRIGWRVGDGVTLELVGQNLFDDSHREFGSATDVASTAIERSVYGRLTWRQ